jgi:hypothetical protein
VAGTACTPKERAGFFFIREVSELLSMLFELENQDLLATSKSTKEEALENMTKVKVLDA